MAEAPGFSERNTPVGENVGNVPQAPGAMHQVPLDTPGASGSSSLGAHPLGLAEPPSGVLEVPPGAYVHLGPALPSNALGSSPWLPDNAAKNCMVKKAIHSTHRSADMLIPCSPSLPPSPSPSPPRPILASCPHPPSSLPPAVLCQRCGEEFTAFTRRHHCRQCGQLFCHRCCNSKALLQPGSGTSPEDRVAAHPVWGAGETDMRKPQKVCGKCFELLLPMQPYLTATVSKAMLQPDFSEASMFEWAGKPISRSFKLELKRAVHTLDSFLGMPDDAWVRSLLRRAHGIGLLTVYKVGFLGAVTGGGGLLLGRDVATGAWSAPCAVGAAGLSIGAQLGGELNEILLVLNTREALGSLMGSTQATLRRTTLYHAALYHAILRQTVPATARYCPLLTATACYRLLPLATLVTSACYTHHPTTQVKLGLNLSVAMGPVGRQIEGTGVAGGKGSASCYAYAVSRGAFAGVALDGTVLFTRDRLNHTFYGHPASATQLLSGRIPPPRAAEPLYRALRSQPPDGAGLGAS